MKESEKTFIGLIKINYYVLKKKCRVNNKELTVTLQSFITKVSKDEVCITCYHNWKKNTYGFKWEFKKYYKRRARWLELV